MSLAGQAATRDIVLVVDDTPDTLGFLTDALENTGFTALVATDLAIIPLKPAIEDIEAAVAAFGAVLAGSGPAG